MREIIKLYIFRHGVIQLLDDVASGIYDAVRDYESNKLTEKSKKVYIAIATELYHLRNNLREEEISKEKS